MRCSIGALALLLALGASSARASAGLRVIPFPGTPDASPSSQVIFSALRPSELRSVTVTGSRSGTHRGRLILLPARAGTAFVPESPFTAGETVRVLAALTSRHAGAESGDPGAEHLSFSFGVGEAARSFSSGVGEATSLSPFDGLNDVRGSSSMASTAYGPSQHFRSEPSLTPPVVTVTKDRDPGAGDIFLTPQESAQVGPMILNARGQLVWFDALKKGSATYYATTLEVERYHGQPVLTWYQGVPLGDAEDVIMNRFYQRVAVVKAGDGYQADLHEFELTPDGNALLGVMTVAHANLTSVGGPPDGVILTNIIQEVDIKTGQVLWEWHSLGHVPIDASYQTYSPQASAYDYFHMNSIQQLPNGNMLISARNTWSVYEISRQTGRVIWTLGGKYSDFKMGNGAGFGWQHDARLHPDGILSLFNDASNFNTQLQARQSSAKLLRINTRDRTVSLVKRFVHSPPLLTGAAGSAQLLNNGNVFVDWGAQPFFSEYDPSGKQIFAGSFSRGIDSYRAFRFPWVGKPRTRPALAVSTRGRTTAYASWNGATQVTSWRVLGGSKKGRLKQLGVTAPETGFETAIRLPRSPRYLAVQALSSRGRVLGTSAAVRS